MFVVKFHPLKSSLAKKNYGTTDKTEFLWKKNQVADLSGNPKKCSILMPVLQVHS